MISPKQKTIIIGLSVLITGFLVADNWEHYKVSLNLSGASGTPTISVTATPSVTNYYGVDDIILTWSTSGATSVSIDSGIGSVATSGSIAVHPPKQSGTSVPYSYTITATNSQGSSTATVAGLIYESAKPKPLPNEVSAVGYTLRGYSSIDGTTARAGDPITFYADFKLNGTTVSGAQCTARFTENLGGSYGSSNFVVSTLDMSLGGDQYSGTRIFDRPQNQVYDVSCSHNSNVLNVRNYALIDVSFPDYKYERTLSSSEKSRLIVPEDVEYMGAFNLPAASGTSRWGFAGSGYGGGGLTHYPNGDPGSNDNYPGSLFGFGHPNNPGVSEISIPTPVVDLSFERRAGCCGQPFLSLPFATTLQPFARISETISLSGIANRANGGLEYLPPQGSQGSGKLYWSFKDLYPAGVPDFSAIGWSNTSLSNLGAAGMWKLNNFKAPNYVGYLLEIPKKWADTYLGGKYLAAGSSGTQSVVTSFSHGPNLMAFAPWQSGNPPAADQSLPNQTLLQYGSGHDRPGFVSTDAVTGGAWPEVGNKSSVIFAEVDAAGTWSYEAGRLGGCTTITGDYTWPKNPVLTFYDPNDLAAVVQGSKSPWEPMPYLTINLQNYFVKKCEHSMSGVALDDANDLLYVVEGELGEAPIVKVFQISDACRKINSKLAKNGTASLQISDNINCAVSPGASATITADYKNSGGAVSGATCSITISGNTSSMIANGSLYVYTRTFSTAGKYPYTIDCSKSGVNSSTVSGTVIVSSAGSETPPPPTFLGDLNNDGIVNSLDWSIMNSRWFTSDETADLNDDGIVNAIDFSILNSNWFRTN